MEETTCLVENCVPISLKADDFSKVLNYQGMIQRKFQQYGEGMNLVRKLAWQDIFTMRNKQL